jgi:ubiquinone/menaquinone biosynthesis C-methylase UbiE
MKKNKDFDFDRSASSYDSGLKGRMSKRFYNLLLSQLKINQGSVILDVGCGTGTVLKRIGETAEINGFGIDASENMIALAKAKCPNMDIFVSGSSRTPFEASKFDIITACMAYHHFDDKKGFAKEAARILKPGGCLYISDPRFPWIIRKPLNTALRIHRVAGFFGTPDEIVSVFKEYGFELDGVSYDKYAQCVKLKHDYPICS